MSHPLTPKLSNLTDGELQKKLGDLSKRLSQSNRLGGPELTYQINLMLQDYQAEMHQRNNDKMNKVRQDANNGGKNFGDSIDIS
jgi:hypothetical protein|tara:strand:- start:133 stop:384 length:252 start_codon:yes stop_codon:yes gene_type:complete